MLNINEYNLYVKMSLLEQLCYTTSERTHVFFIGTFLSKQSSFVWSRAHNLDIYTLHSLPYHQLMEDLFGLCLLLWRLLKIPQKYTEALTGGLSGRSNSTLDFEAERALSRWQLPHSALKMPLTRTTSWTSGAIPTPGVPFSAVLALCSVCLAPIKCQPLLLQVITCPSTATPHCKIRLLVLPCPCKRSVIT